MPADDLEKGEKGREGGVRLPTQVLAVGAALFLSACSNFPDVATLEGPAGPPPPLLPLEGLLPEPAQHTDPAPALTARAGALRSRAGAIGAP
jgi:hypothetical protein